MRCQIDWFIWRSILQLWISIVGCESWWVWFGRIFEHWDAKCWNLSLGPCSVSGFQTKILGCWVGRDVFFGAIAEPLRLPNISIPGKSLRSIDRLEELLPYCCAMVHDARGSPRHPLCLQWCLFDFRLQKTNQPFVSYAGARRLDFHDLNLLARILGTCFWILAFSRQRMKSCLLSLQWPTRTSKGGALRTRCLAANHLLQKGLFLDWNLVDFLNEYRSIYQNYKRWTHTPWIFCHAMPAKLIKKRTNDILLTCKAYNGRVVCEWLGARVREAATVPAFVAEDSRLPMCAMAQKLNQSRNWIWLISLLKIILVFFDGKRVS